MPQLRGALDGGAEHGPDRLVAEAHPEGGDAALRAPAQDGHAGPRARGLAGPRADEHSVDLVDEGHDVVGVVAPDHRVGPELRQVLDEVVDEAVVVVDDEDPHGAHDTAEPASATPAWATVGPESVTPGWSTAVPKSKVRRKPAYTPPPRASAARTAGPSHPAYVGVMLGVGILGLAWLVVNYLAAEKIPFMAALGGYNFLIGFGLIVISLLMTMRWR